MTIVLLYIQSLIKEMFVGLVTSSLLFFVNFPNPMGLLSKERKFDPLDKKKYWSYHQKTLVSTGNLPLTYEVTLGKFLCLFECQL